MTAVLQSGGWGAGGLGTEPGTHGRPPSEAWTDAAPSLAFSYPSPHRRKSDLQLGDVTYTPPRSSRAHDKPHTHLSGLDKSHSRPWDSQASVSCFSVVIIKTTIAILTLCRPWLISSVAANPRYVDDCHTHLTDKRAQTGGGGSFSSFIELETGGAEVRLTPRLISLIIIMEVASVPGLVLALRRRRGRAHIVAQETQCVCYAQRTSAN